MNKNNLKSFSLIIGCLVISLVIINLVSANGLQISETSINMNKTDGVDAIVTLTIRNTEPFTFYNISFTDTLNSPLFNLDSGQNKTISFTLNSSGNINKTLILRGYYITNIGQSNKTESVNITYPGGLDRCNLNLISGDTIKWNNNVLGEVTIKNSDTQQNIATIQQGSSYSLRFYSPESFNYQVFRIGIAFTSVCNINVMGTSGLVFNTDYDARIPINVKMSYPATTIVTTFLTTSYNLSYNSQTQDIFSIKNTGDKIAKNIILSEITGWIIFGNNNFDLSPGQSINVGYTLRPLIYDTSQTNRTHTLKIYADGNFQEITQNLSVFIPYENVGSVGNLTQLSPEVLQQLILIICKQYPNFQECKKIGGVTNYTIKEVSAIFTEDTIFEMIKRQAEREDQQATWQNIVNEQMQNFTMVLGYMSDKLNNLSDANNKLSSAVESANASSLFLGIMFIFITIAVILVVMIIRKRSQVKILSEGKFHKGELPY